MKKSKKKGTVVEVQIGIIRSDWDPSIHGSELSFWDHDPPLFQAKDGTILPDIEKSTVEFNLFYQFKQGHSILLDGYAFEDKKFHVEAQGTLGGKEAINALISIIKEYASENETIATRIAGNIMSLCSASRHALGFESMINPSEEIRAKYESKFEWIAVRGEGDQLNCEDKSFAGSVFVDIVSWKDASIPIYEDGTLAIDDLDFAEYRQEEFRMIGAIKIC